MKWQDVVVPGLDAVIRLVLVAALAVMLLALAGCGSRMEVPDLDIRVRSGVALPVETPSALKSTSSVPAYSGQVSPVVPTLPTSAGS